MITKQSEFNKLIKESIDIDYSGNYSDLHEFILDNDLQQKFSILYNIDVDEWEDYSRGELGYDNEVISKILGDDYRIFYSEDDDEFIVSKKNDDKIDFQIILSENEEISNLIYSVGIHTEYASRFGVFFNKKLIGGSTFNLENNVYKFDVGILEEYQGYGISKDLINKIINDAKSLGANIIEAEVVNKFLFDYLLNIGFDSDNHNDVVYLSL